MLKKKRVKRDRGEGKSSSCEAFKRGVCYLVTWVPIEPVTGYMDGDRGV